MSLLLTQIISLIERGEIKISLYGYEELYNDNIFIRDIVAGLKDALVVETYPDFPKGPCLLLLQRDDDSKAIHVVWGIWGGGRTRGANYCIQA